MVESHRLFCCVRCHRQIRICTRCDRGNVYCSPLCAGCARRRTLREAGRRYQQTMAGRRKHASRQLRYQLRLRKKMTHQGTHKELVDIRPAADTAKESTKQPAVQEEVSREHDVQSVSENNATQTTSGQKAKTTRCHFCGGPCGAFTRLGPLRCLRVRRGRRRQARQPVAHAAGA